ncbi:hypothetical protein BKA65DRAFT_511634 [Rhexocercosporidium sp. MPI-PUGE-AT-0058]|nr:hypothetical protein BKA65DRAFT_511634 [Rhexocercosporidium sp. MPI-PUGE-AT-0058]
MFSRPCLNYRLPVVQSIDRCVYNKSETGSYRSLNSKNARSPSFLLTIDLALYQRFCWMSVSQVMFLSCSYFHMRKASLTLLVPIITSFELVLVQMQLVEHLGNLGSQQSLTPPYLLSFLFLFVTGSYRT